MTEGILSNSFQGVRFYLLLGVSGGAELRVGGVVDAWVGLGGRLLTSRVSGSAQGSERALTAAQWRIVALRPMLISRFDCALFHSVLFNAVPFAARRCAWMV